jgi:tetratricopeptide (TPR) repeat protein
MSDVTRILDQIQQGNRSAASELLPLVYAELRRLAIHRMSKEKPGLTLQPTALVHEAYIRLVGDEAIARQELETFTDRLQEGNVLIASARAHADAERWAEAYRGYTDAIEIQPKYFLGWLERGRLNTKLGRWKEGADDFANALEIGLPINKTELLGVPQLLIYAGRLEAYKKLRGALEHMEDDPSAVAIRGQLVGDISASTAAELAERVEKMLSSAGVRQDFADRAAEGGQAAAPPRKMVVDKKHKYAGMYYGANLYIAGWAHLRAGNHQKAIERLEESNSTRNVFHPRPGCAALLRRKGKISVRRCGVVDSASCQSALHGDEPRGGGISRRGRNGECGMVN